MDVFFHGLIIDPTKYASRRVFRTPDLDSICTSCMQCSEPTFIREGNNLSPAAESGSYLRATRFPVGTVGAKPRRNNMYANELLAPLRHPIPPPSQSTPPSGNMYMTCVSVFFEFEYFGEWDLRAVILMEPSPPPRPPPPQLCIGRKSSSVGKTPISLILNAVEVGVRPWQQPL